MAKTGQEKTEKVASGHEVPEDKQEQQSEKDAHQYAASEQHVLREEEMVDVSHHDNAPPSQKGELFYQQQIEELKDQMLRAMAEVENTKRRADLDISKARDFAITSFAKDMVTVLDHLFRACENIIQENVEESPQLNGVKEGVELTKKEMLNALARHGITRIDPKGEVFDHNYHQALSQAPSEEHPSHTVIEVIQPGYKIKERLLRPALVVVAQ